MESNFTRYIIPKNYQICYDSEKDYNNNDFNDSYLPPYRSDFPSIYKGLEIEIQIVDHCNLNCNQCNHFAPLADPWFITEEEFADYCRNICNNIPTMRRLMLLGGEPTLHPSLLKLCKLAREYFPGVRIDVLTNGILVQDLIHNKEEYEKLNINFIFTYYPNYTKYEKIEQELSSIGTIFHSRVFSKETILDTEGSQDGFTNFFNCETHKLPCFTVRDNKLYICPTCAHFHLFSKKAQIKVKEEEGKDFLYLDKIKNNLDIIQKFTFTPKTYCNYCVLGCDATPFSLSKKDIEEFTVPLYDLYLKDYPRYEELINSNAFALNNIISEGHYNTVDQDFEKVSLSKELVRYGAGKVDIIIPYYNENIELFKALRENLLTQTIIEDCCIYFISDCGNMDLGVINLFKNNSKLHCFFYRTDHHGGPGLARNKGIKEAHNEYILCLDADDGFLAPNSLEKLYNNISNSHAELLVFNTYNKDKSANKEDFIISHSFISEKELYYKPFFFCEDVEYLIRVKLTANSFIYLKENNLIGYNLNKNINLSSTFYLYDPIFFTYLTPEFIGLYEKQINNNPDLYKKLIEQYLFRLVALFYSDNIHKNLLKDEFVQELLSFILFYLNKFDSSIYLNKDYQKLEQGFTHRGYSFENLIENLLLYYKSNGKFLKENIYAFINILTIEKRNSQINE